MWKKEVKSPTTSNFQNFSCKTEIFILEYKKKKNIEILLFSYREYRVQRNVKIIFHNSKHEYKHFLKTWIINEIMILYDIEYKIKLSPRGILILFNYTWNSLRHCDNCIVRGN